MPVIKRPLKLDPTEPQPKQPTPTASDPAKTTRKQRREALRLGVHPDLLDPHYFDTNPDDEGYKYLDSEEREWRDRHRRESFERCLIKLSESFDLYLDEYDWTTDESQEGYHIPVSQLRDAVELAESLGFGCETTEDPEDDFDGWDDEETTRIWVFDPVVAALIPEDYNCYTLRAPEEES